MATGTYRRGNEFRIHTDHVEIIMPRRDGSESVAVVDLADLALVKQHTWGMSNGYAASQSYASGRGSEKTTIFLHRLVLGLPHGAGHGRQVDHIDRDRLNNRRSNLREVNASVNMRNTELTNRCGEGFRGVSYQHGNTWKAQMSAGVFNGRQRLVYLGSFESPVLAARAYDFAVLDLNDPHAALNFPEDRERYVSGEIPRPVRRTKNSSRAKRVRKGATPA